MRDFSLRFDMYSQNETKFLAVTLNFARNNLYLYCSFYFMCLRGVNSTAQGFSVEDTMTDISYFNITEIKLSNTSPYILPVAQKYEIIWTENSDVIDSFISEILKYESSVTVSSTEKPGALLFTPTITILDFSQISDFIE